MKSIVTIKQRKRLEHFFLVNDKIISFPFQIKRLNKSKYISKYD